MLKIVIGFGEIEELYSKSLDVISSIRFYLCHELINVSEFNIDTNKNICTKQFGDAYFIHFLSGTRSSNSQHPNTNPDPNSVMPDGKE